MPLPLFINTGIPVLIFLNTAIPVLLCVVSIGGPNCYMSHWWILPQSLLIDNMCCSGAVYVSSKHPVYLLQEGDDIDACIHEINKVLSSSASPSVASSAVSDFAAAKPLLSIEHR